MFTLTRLRGLRAPLARANSTLESLSSASSIPSPPAPSSPPSDVAAPHDADPVPTPAPRQRTQGRRNLKYPAIRPSISLERPREWNLPVAPGVIPAYDQALAYIRADAAAVQAEADALQLSLEKGTVPAEDVEDAKKQLDVLEVMAQVNLPEVRWKAANGMGLCSQLSSNCGLTDAALGHSGYEPEGLSSPPRTTLAKRRRFGPSCMLFYPSILLVQYHFLNKLADGTSLPDARYSRRPPFAQAHS